METIFLKFLNQKLGDFLQVDSKNVQLSPGSGQLSLRQASVRADVFDGLHFPLALRGGFLEEVAVNFSAGLFASDGGGAKVVVKNVFLALGPHTSDWSLEHVYDCKSKLVDLVMKVYELKGTLKKRKVAESGKEGYFASIKQRMSEKVAKHFLGMLEVHVSNVHIRYEDDVTQPLPFACGLKVGFIGVTSDDKPQRSFLFGFDDPGDTKKRLPRATGEWLHSTHRHSDPLFRQSVATRRVSAYWDIGGDAADLFATRPASGRQVKDNFSRLNLRETFSACVVDKLLEIFPPDHPRRKVLQGPSFRERLDFHQYLLFPVSINAHIVANRASEACLQQQAPLKDADVVIERLEVAVDTEQIRSINQLVAFAQEFKRKDALLRTRPSDSIGKYLSEMVALQSAPRSDSAGRDVEEAVVESFSAEDARSELVEKKRRVVQAWWRHALEGVRVLGQLPRHASRVDAAELQRKARDRERYIDLCLQAAALDAKITPAKDLHPSHPVRRLREMQVRLDLPEVLEWRLQALEMAPKAAATLGATGPSGASDSAAGSIRGGQLGMRRSGSFGTDISSAAASAPPAPLIAAPAAPPVVKGVEKDAKPSTLQVQVRLLEFDVHVLASASRLWIDALAARIGVGSASPAAKGKRRRRRTVARQVLAKGQVSGVQLEAVQKGFEARRVARWVELRVGGISAENCCARQGSAARPIFSMSPFESSEAEPACVFVGLTMLESKDGSFQAGDIPLTAVLDPAVGLRSHLRPARKQETPAQLQRMGFLKEYKDEPGRLLTFAYVRAGAVRAVDVAAYRRRLLGVMKRGSNSGGKVPDLVRNPSLAALDRELMHRMQKKVEMMVGKSNMLSAIEGAFDGMEVRAVDDYNARNSLCKGASLGALQFKALMCGCPQAMQVLVKRVPRPDERLQSSGGINTAGFDIGAMALPWKVSMFLVPKADYDLGEDAGLPIVDALSMTGKSNDSREDWRREAEVAQRLSGSPISKKGKKGKKASRPSITAVRETSRDRGNREEQTSEPLPGAWFRKWGRKRTPRMRFVLFDEASEAIVWKNKETDKSARGMIPLSKVQDVCVGAKTPLLRSVRHVQFQEGLSWSVVASDRTLDLQAESMAVQVKWVAWLRERFKQYYFANGLNREVRATGSLLFDAKSKAFPSSLRPPQGELCTLLRTCRRLHSVTSIGRVLRRAEAPRDRGASSRGPAGPPEEAEPPPPDRPVPLTSLSL